MSCARNPQARAIRDALLDSRGRPQAWVTWGLDAERFVGGLVGQRGGALSAAVTWAREGCPQSSATVLRQSGELLGWTAAIFGALLIVVPPLWPLAPVLGPILGLMGAVGAAMVSASLGEPIDTARLAREARGAAAVAGPEAEAALRAADRVASDPSVRAAARAAASSESSSRRSSTSGRASTVSKDTATAAADAREVAALASVVRAAVQRPEDRASWPRPTLSGKGSATLAKVHRDFAREAATPAGMTPAKAESYFVDVEARAPTSLLGRAVTLARRPSGGVPPPPTSSSGGGLVGLAALGAALSFLR